MREGRDEIDQLARSGRSLPGAAEPLMHFLRDLDDPRRIVEIDARAARTCDDPSKPCWSTGRPAPTGYTAIEGVMNYAYYLSSATSQFDEVGHLLHFAVDDQGVDPCSSYTSGYDPETGEPGVWAKDGETKTTDILETHRCVSWLGPNQPGINEDLNLPPFDPEVCEHGTEPEAAEEYCFNAEAESDAASRRIRDAGRTAFVLGDLARDGAPRRERPRSDGLRLPRDLQKSLGDLPEVGKLLPDRDPGEPLSPRPRRSSDRAIRDLLEFMFGR